MKKIGAVILYLFLTIVLEIGCAGNCDKFGPKTLTSVSVFQGRSNIFGNTLQKYDSVNSLDLRLFIGFNSKDIASGFSFLNKAYARKECPTAI